MPRKGHPETGQGARASAEADLYHHIGDRIRSNREALGWTQEKLAAELGVTPNTVSRWETATYRPSALDLDSLARILGIDIWAFFPSSVEAPTEEQKALLSATGDLPPDDIEELKRYASFIRARKALKEAR